MKRGYNMNEKYLTTNEAAVLLKITPRTVRLKIKNKQLSSIKKEGRILIPKREINNLIKKYKDNPERYKNTTNIFRK
jgi:excisionase family DNA binding protein